MWKSHFAFSPDSDVTVSAESAGGATAGNDSSGATIDSGNLVVDGSPSANIKAPEVSNSNVQTAIAVEEEPKAIDEADLEPVDFDVNAWDGNLEVLPDTYKTFADKYRGFVDTEYKGKLEAYKDYKSPTDIEQLNSDLTLYKALADGQEDPRLAIATSRVTNLEATLEQIKVDSLKAIEVMQGRVEAVKEQAYKEWRAGFERRHEQVFGDKEKTREFIQLYEEHDVDPDALATMIGIPEKIQKEILGKIKADSVPDNLHALIVESVLAKHGLGSGHLPDDSPSAMLTSGANGLYNNRVPMMNIPTNKMDMDSARKLAAQRAFKVIK